MAESQTSPRLLEANRRQAQAVALRIGGASLQQIADALGYASASGAHEALKAAMSKTLREPADELRNLQRDRLEALLRGLWPGAAKGNLRNVDRAVKIVEQLVKLDGLAAPIRVKDETPTKPWRVRVLEYLEAVEDEPAGDEPAGA